MDVMHTREGWCMAGGQQLHMARWCSWEAHQEFRGVEAWLWLGGTRRPNGRAQESANDQQCLAMQLRGSPQQLCSCHDQGPRFICY